MINYNDKIKIKNRSHRYDINRPRARHGCKYIKYNIFISMMMYFMYQGKLDFFMTEVPII